MYLEAYSRCENVKFENIPEEETNKEDTQTVLRTFLETELGFGDAANIEIQRVHRLGKKRGENPRPILARFLRYVTLHAKRGLKDFTENREIFSRSWCVNFNFHGVKRRNHFKTKNFHSWRETNHAVNDQ